MLAEQKAALQSWARAKFNEVNSPMADSDAWVHRRVLEGGRGFLNPKGNRPLVAVGVTAQHQAQ